MRVRPAPWRLLRRRDRAPRSGGRHELRPAERRGDPGHRPGRAPADRLRREWYERLRTVGGQPRRGHDRQPPLREREQQPEHRRPAHGADAHDRRAAADRHAGHSGTGHLRGRGDPRHAALPAAGRQLQFDVRLRTRGLARHRRLPDRGHQPAALHLQPWPPDPGAYHRLHGRTERRPRPPARPDAAAGGCPAPPGLTTEYHLASA